MSAPDRGEVAPLARRDGEPVFDEPWQAQALGLALTLSERGAFTPHEWSRALGAAHRALLDVGEADTPGTYYEAVAAALEHLVGESGMLTAATIENRAHAWRRAYLATPHGAPVLLEAGLDNAEGENASG